MTHMEVKASLRNLRMAPRKVRLVVDLVRGLPVAEAELRLQFCRQAAARPVLKLLKSAIANAEHNFKLEAAGLRIKTITADGGPMFKRTMPRAMGSGTMIRKRQTHINLSLTDEPAPANPKAVSRKPKVTGARAKPAKKPAVAKAE
jgi:large subunit ribosomal protein L22